MALNFSHRSNAPQHPSEDNLVKPLRISSGYLMNGIPEKDVFVLSGLSHKEPDDSFDHDRDRCDVGGLHDPVSKDIVGIFPSDHFGMDITEWLEVLRLDYAAHGKDGSRADSGNYQLYAKFNFISDNVMRFRHFPHNIGHFHNPPSVGCFDGCLVEKEEYLPCHDGFGSARIVDEILNFCNDDFNISIERGEKLNEENFDAKAPHAALSFSLDYLGLRDLLAVEMVCKSLCSIVRGDPFYWRSIHVDHPLNGKITDDILLQLTSRAQGNLQCLSLVECQKITDDGLRRVLESNPRLTKLGVPGCTRLSAEGIVNSLRAFKAMGAQGIKTLRIGGIYAITRKHFQELKFLLGSDSKIESTSHKPRFYDSRNLYVSFYDDCAIDIEMCPRCKTICLVYDCPGDNCVGIEQHAAQECRACSFCISCCGQCGRCFNGTEYEETFCFELRCSDCSTEL